MNCDSKLYLHRRPDIDLSATTVVVKCYYMRLQNTFVLEQLVVFLIIYVLFCFTVFNLLACLFFRPSDSPSVRACVRDYMFPRYLQYLIDGFSPNFCHWCIGTKTS